MAAAPDFTLNDLIDLALCSPEVGAVNFNILRVVLLELVHQLGVENVHPHLDDVTAHQIQNFKNYTQGAGTSSPMPGVLRYNAPGYQYVSKTPRAARRSLEKADAVIADTAPSAPTTAPSSAVISDMSSVSVGVLQPGSKLKSGDAGTKVIAPHPKQQQPTVAQPVPNAMSAKIPPTAQYKELENKVARLERHMEALYALPTNSTILNTGEAGKAAAEKPEGMSVNDMWQIIQLNNRAAAAEAAIQKMASLIEDLAKGLNTLKQEKEAAAKAQGHGSQLEGSAHGQAAEGGVPSGEGGGSNTVGGKVAGGQGKGGQAAGGGQGPEGEVPGGKGAGGKAARGQAAGGGQGAGTEAITVGTAQSVPTAAPPAPVPEGGKLKSGDAGTKVTAPQHQQQLTVPQLATNTAGAKIPSTAQYEEMQNKVAQLEKHLETLNALPPTTSTILRTGESGTAEKPEGMSVNEKRQIFDLNNRVATAEAAIQKMVKLNEDLTKGLNTLKQAKEARAATIAGKSPRGLTILKLAKEAGAAVAGTGKVEDQGQGSQQPEGSTSVRGQGADAEGAVSGGQGADSKAADVQGEGSQGVGGPGQTEGDQSGGAAEGPQMSGSVRAGLEASKNAVDTLKKEFDNAKQQWKEEMETFLRGLQTQQDQQGQPGGGVQGQAPGSAGWQQGPQSLNQQQQRGTGPGAGQQVGAARQQSGHWQRQQLFGGGRGGQQRPGYSESHTSTGTMKSKVGPRPRREINVLTEKKGPEVSPDDLQTIFTNLNNLLTISDEQQDRIEQLYEVIEQLHAMVVTKPMLVDAMGEKADKEEINTKVSYDEFGDAIDELANKLQTLLVEVYQKNEGWKRITDKLIEEMGDKLDKYEIGPLRAYFKSHLGDLEAQVTALVKQFNEPDPAGTRKKLIKDCYCISCDRHCNISGVTNSLPLPCLGASMPGPTGQTSASHRAYDLFNLRNAKKAFC